MDPFQKKIVVQDLIDACSNKSGLSRFSVGVALLCAIVMFADGFNTQIIGFIAPAITKEWVISKATLGSVFSAGFAGLLAGLILFSPLPGTIGPKRVVLLCTAMFGVCTMLTLLSNSVASLMIYRFITGIGLGGAIPSAISLTGEYAPRKRLGTIMLLWSTGFAFGAVVGGVLSSLMLTRYGWRPILLIGGLLPTCTSVLLVFYMPESINFLLRKPQYRPRAVAILRRIDPRVNVNPATLIEYSGTPRVHYSLFGIFRDGRLLGTVMLWGVFFVTLMETFCLQSWLPTVLVDQGFSIPTATGLGTLLSASGVAAVLIVGPSIDRFGPYRVMGSLFVLGSVCVAALGPALTLPVTGIMVVVVLAGICVGGTQKAASALIVYYYPTDLCAVGAGWSYGIGRLGAIAGPIVIGLALHSGLPSATLFYFGAVPMLCAAGFISILGYLARHPRNAAWAAAPGDSARLGTETAPPVRSRV